MDRRKKRSGGVLVPVVSGLLGALVGLGGGYFVFTKRPAMFEASAIVQIARTPTTPADRSEPPETDATQSGSPSANQLSSESFNAVEAPLSEVADVIDESLFILSDAVVSKAVVLGQLDKLPELREGDQSLVGNPEQAAAALRRGGNLQAQRTALASNGAIYEVRFRGATPSSCQDVVAAVVAACQQVISQSGSSADWKETIELLGGAAGNVTRRLVELEAQLDELSVSTDVALDGETIVSAQMEQLRRLRNEADQRLEELLLVEKQLRSAETLIVEGAPAANILASLSQTMSGKPESSGSTPGEKEAAKQAAERQKQLQLREKLASEVERELSLLQLELDRLLKTLGSGHPTVQAVRAKMSRVRAPLDDLPPLEPTPSGNRDPKTTSPQNEPKGRSDSQQVSLLLRVLRAQKQRLQEELDKVTAEVDTAAGEVAKQENALNEQSRIRSEIEQEQLFGQQIAARLDQLSAASPVPTNNLTVLIAPGPGVQVAPNIVPHLTTGGIAGLLAGSLLGSLLLLTSAASTTDESES